MDNPTKTEFMVEWPVRGVQTVIVEAATATEAKALADRARRGEDVEDKVEFITFAITSHGRPNRAVRLKGNRDNGRS